jgi:hypothetical protein
VTVIWHDGEAACAVLVEVPGAVADAENDNRSIHPLWVGETTDGPEIPDTYMTTSTAAAAELSIRGIAIKASSNTQQLVMVRRVAGCIVSLLIEREFAHPG